MEIILYGYIGHEKLQNNFMQENIKAQCINRALKTAKYFFEQE